MQDEFYTRNNTRVQKFVWQQGSVTQENSVTLLNNRQGYKNLDYKAVIAKGENATSPYTCIVRRAGATLTDVRYQRFGIPWHCYGYYYSDLAGYLNETLSDPVRAESRATSKIVKEWYSRKRGPHSIGVFLGEARDTIRLIKSPIETLAKYLRSNHHRLPDTEYARLRRLRRMLGRYGTNDAIPPKLRARYADEKSHALRAITKKYLEWRYGLDPLIRDVSDAMGEYRGLLDTQVPSHERFSGVDSGTTLQKGNASVDGYASQYTRHLHGKSVHVIGCRINVSAVAPQSSIEAAHRVLGLDATWEDVKREFVPTIWQLLPLSFLVDTFTNISEVLEAVYFVASDCKVYSHTRVGMSTIEETRLPITSGSRHYVRGTWGSWYYTKFTLTRSVETGLRMPRLAFNAPNLFGQLSVDLTALLAGSRRGKLPLEGL